MATNPYFNYFYANNEQTLVEDLVVECIKMYAHDMYYLPRSGVNKDDTLNEFEYNTYNTALPCEFYIKSSDSFEGQGSFMEKFGVQVKDQLTLTMSKRSFTQFVQPTTGKPRPMEGDLVYIPMIDAVYTINYAETAMPFYVLGKLNVYDINLELYEVSGDVFQTGITAIDTKYNAYANNANDPFDQSSSFEINANNVIDFTETNPFTDGF